MSGGRRGTRPPRDLLGPLAGRVLALVVPEDVRECYVGDLVEEAQCFIAPARGFWRTRLWLWGQILGSLPALLVWRDGKEGSMWKRRLIVVVSGLVAVAQAWDSHVFQSTLVVVALVLAGIGLAVAAGVIAVRRGLYLTALVAALLLLAVARIVSPTPLPDFFIIPQPFVVLALLWDRIERPNGAATA